MNKFGLIGEKLTHSFSPHIHKLLGDYEYKLYEVAQDDFDNFMKKNDLDGFNVTIPYKQKVIPYCKELSDNAKNIGSVNLIIRKSDGTFYGDNTDYYGFSYLVGNTGKNIHGKKAIILGSGGASKTVNAVLKDLGASPVTVISRNGVNNYENINRHYDADIIVNTTPVGMYPENGKTPLDLKPFVKCGLVLDLIYNPAKTRLLLQAEQLDISCYNGLAMLVAQAKKASEIFSGRTISDDEIKKIHYIVYRNMMNVMLIGMPGCGKSSVGAELAKLTKRRFFDMDEMIEKAARMTIPEIFAAKGEKIFRELETHTLEEISKLSGVIISTGGGIVTQPRNKQFIRQNSTVIFLERDLRKLPITGRPISQSNNIEDLYKERLPFYRAWSDYVIESTEISQTAQKIKEELKL